MPSTTINPTRMELTRLKGKLKTAQRGHKLLKDKRDELMKQFLDTVREVRTLRAQVEEELMRVHSSFTVASALMSGKALEQALMYPKQGVELDMTFRNVMSVNVPIYHYKTRTDDRRVNALEYVVIPQTEEAIRYISMKLDENDRATTTRLMKVKDMLLKEAIEDRRAEDARAARVFGSSGEAPQQV